MASLWSMTLETLAGNLQAWVLESSESSSTPVSGIWWWLLTGGLAGAAGQTPRMVSLCGLGSTQHDVWIPKTKVEREKGVVGGGSWGGGRVEDAILYFMTSTWKPQSVTSATFYWSRQLQVAAWVQKEGAFWVPVSMEACWHHILRKACKAGYIVIQPKVTFPKVERTTCYLCVLIINVIHSYNKTIDGHFHIRGLVLTYFNAGYFKSVFQPMLNNNDAIWAFPCSGVLWWEEGQTRRKPRQKERKR